MRRITLPSSLILPLCACGPLSAAQYSMIEIPAPLTEATGLNNKGEVVGSDAGNGAYYYQHSSGVVVQLPGGWAVAGINDGGKIVGTTNSPTGTPPLVATVWYLSGGSEQLWGGESIGTGVANSGAVVGITPTVHLDDSAVLWRWKDHSITHLGTLVVNNPHNFVFDPSSHASAVNNQIHIVGMSDVIVGNPDSPSAYVTKHAFLWQNGAMADLGALPGGKYSTARGVNGKDASVGGSETAKGYHAFVHQQGQMVDLGNLANDPKLNSEASGINDRGEVVGWSEVRLAADNSITQRAFVYSWGRMWNLTFQVAPSSALAGKVRLTDAVAINCNGWIAANGYDVQTHANHAYLLMLEVPQRPECPRPK
jgi:probable HAF family extracellular repeat protein